MLARQLPCLIKRIETNCTFFTILFEYFECKFIRDQLPVLMKNEELLTLFDPGNQELEVLHHVVHMDEAKGD